MKKYQLLIIFIVFSLVVLGSIIAIAAQPSYSIEQIFNFVHNTASRSLNVE